MNYETKVFNDAIHGSIELHPLCIKVIDTVQFQRLRFIKQLGVTHFIYPSASHCRFEHSLGVCHLAGLFTRSLRNRQPELNITDKDILCVQLAGLCHDLGHGPFSHMWEMFVNEIRPKRNWKHEEMSLKMLDHLIKENSLETWFQRFDLTVEDVTFIKEMICPPVKSSNESSNWPFEGRPREKGFLYQIVSNSENGIDVDKWDYFLRDTHSLGIQKVTFLYDRLIKFSRVIDSSSSSSFPNYKICFRDKEATEIPEMFRSRMLLHQKAYQHRVVKVIDRMLIDALVLANDHVTTVGKGGKEYSLADAVDDPVALTSLNDDVFHRIHLHSSNHPNMVEARCLITDILTRRYYPLIGKSLPVTFDVDTEAFLQQFVHNLPKKSSLKAEDLAIFKIVLNYGNGPHDPLSRVGIFTKEEPHVYRMIHLNQLSMLLPAAWEEKTYGIFCRKHDAELVREAKIAFKMTCLNWSPRLLNFDSSKLNGNA